MHFEDEFDESFDSFEDGSGVESYDSDEVDRFVQKKVEQLQILRENVNWEIKEERINFLRQFAILTRDWTAQYPNLRDYFRDEEIECLLLDSTIHWAEKIDCTGWLIISFVARTGYKDEPKVDKYGKPLLRRTTPVHHAIKCDYFHVLDFLFYIYDSFDVNYVDESGLTHFHVACMLGCKNIVQKFLQLGQDPNILVTETGDSPLHLAVHGGYEETVELLLERGADPNLVNKDELTPLHTACKKSIYNYNEVLEIILKMSEQRTLQLDARDKLGNTPLHYALTYQHQKQVKLLLRNGADLNLANMDGSTPLHMICKKKHLFNLLMILFEISDDRHQPLQVDARDKLGRTPLQLAVANLSLDAVYLLLDRGADLSHFTFPDETYFAKNFDAQLGGINFKLELASGALAITEGLEGRGYQLDRIGALTIMKFFAQYKLFESEDLDERLYDDEEFARETKNKMICHELSLYDLIQLRPEEEDKLLSYSDYLEFAQSNIWWNLPVGLKDTCLTHMCEIMARGFFQRFALDPFWDLIHKRLPIECCQMIIEKLKNEDLYTICLAAAGRRSLRVFFSFSHAYNEKILNVTERLQLRNLYKYTKSTFDTYVIICKNIDILVILQRLCEVFLFNNQS